MKREPSQSNSRRQRGAGALIVVLVLFFVMSLVAAYSSRNIIFEQKTSANQYRSTQAAEVAEAGIEWALGMLNAGNIDANCLPSDAGISFRNRYLTIDTTTGANSGNISPTTWLNGGVTQEYWIGCVGTGVDANWNCKCPTNANPALAAPAGVNTTAPAFVVWFQAGATPGTVLITSLGCTMVDLNPQGCLNPAAHLPQTGGTSMQLIQATLALKGAIATPPSAALTTLGSVCAGNAAMTFTNTEPGVNGVTIDAGGTITPACGGNPPAVPPNWVLSSVPGTPQSTNSLAPGDSTLSNWLVAGAAPDVPQDRYFNWVFGLPRSAYQWQPAAIRINCPCDPNALAATAAANPGHVLWLTGDANLNAAAAVSIGTPASPVVMIVNGNITAPGSPVTVNGLVYSYGAPGWTWTIAGALQVQGAAIAEGSFDGTGNAHFVYDLGVLNTLRLSSGSFVRVPGSWQG
ncbi:MAG: pilus assembly PilX N-terminal domain-containing protein [Burkholderiales bacterium]|nr:pilus assembly PilX N-terminal domain-containing protein [Burkholderiales bacterium]